MPPRPRLRELARKLPPPVVRLARRVHRRAAGDKPSALVSVIVPLYNVEKYVDECLTSLRDQHYRTLEIIVIDDGSTDRSAEIVARHAADDPRIRVVRQPNGGLGAARNAGIRNARGDYLCFVDSDDVMPAHGVLRMVNTAERSGSDLVVGALARFDSNGRRRPKWMHLHSETRIGVSPSDFPQIVRNNYTPGKLYRTDFWRRCGLWFREGVAYEDQPLVTQLYARASRIDVLPMVTYEWRRRDDASSISQQVHTLSDLRDRIEAWNLSLSILTTEATEPIYEAWLETIYSTHFHWYLNNKSIVQDAYWEEIRAAVVKLMDVTPQRVLASVEPQHRVAVELVRRNLRQEFDEFRRQHGYSPSRFPAELGPAGLTVQLPTFEDPDVDLPPEMYRFPDEHIPLIHRVDTAAWTGDGRLRVAGWGYFRYVDLSVQQTLIDLTLEHVRTGEQLEATIEPNADRRLSPPLEDKWADYVQGCFTAVFRVRELMDRCDPQPGDTWRFLLRVRTGRLDRTTEVSEVQDGGSAQHLAPYLFDTWLLHGAPPVQPNFKLHCLRREVVADRMHLEGRALSGRLKVTTGARIRSLQLVRLGSDAEHEFTVGSADDGVVPFAFNLPSSMVGRRKSDQHAAMWSLRAVMTSGDVALVTTGAELTRSLGARIGECGVTVERSYRAGVTLVVGPVSVEFDSAQIEDDVLHLSGRTRGVDTCALTLSLTAPKATSSPASVEVRDGTFEVSVPLRHRAWRFGELPLPTAIYTVDFVVSTPEGQRQGTATVSDLLTEQLPVEQHSPTTTALLKRFVGRALRVRLMPPVDADARGPFRRNRLELAARSRERSDRLEGLFIQANFGEIAGCNGAPVHEELRRRGADIPVFWSVVDYSVPVPEGGIPVARNSSEWFRRMRTAKYYIENMYQPPYYRKPPGQVIIATFHGYPFKQMGHPHWENLQMSRAAIDSMDERADEWDYLVSPARYATPLLTRDFAYHGPVLEIGYPRNDVLQSPEAPGIRRSTRRELGISADVTAILYAPTFRDYLSADDHRASMGDFLDAELLARRLGDRYAILVRGHAFHARTRHRIRISPQIIDVTDYPDPADLYLASDLAVLDYSSLRFDYAITTKPMLFLVPDLERYQQTRGWLLDYEPTAPGPFLSTTDEVAGAVLDIEAVVAEYAEAYEIFHKSFLDLEDGHAAARFVDAVFVPRGDAPAR